jgi:ABC-type multidrug transport system fused ATPase/permease subunit
LQATNILCQGLYSFSDIWITVWTAEEETKLLKVGLLPDSCHSFPSQPGAGPALPSPVVQNTSLTTVLDLTGVDTHLGEHYWNLGVYGAIVAALCVSSMIRTVYFFVLCMKSSVKLHDKMFESIIRAPCRFFDTNPVGELLAISYVCQN